MAADPTAARFEDDEEVQARIMAEVPGLRARWDATEPKRRVAGFLIAMRSRAGLSQSEVARRAGWDKAFVSRLEGAMGGLPGWDTLARYAAACGQELGLVSSARPALSTIHIDAAMTITSEAGQSTEPAFERLSGRDLELTHGLAEEAQLVCEP